MMGLATAQTKWSATLNALPSCSPQGHSQTTLHYARGCYATTFVFTPLARKQVCDKGKGDGIGYCADHAVCSA